MSGVERSRAERASRDQPSGVIRLSKQDACSKYSAIGVSISLSSNDRESEESKSTDVVYA